MTPSSSERRKRFERAAKAAHSLTPLKVHALRLLSESRFLSTPQVAGIMGISDHAARGHLRDLYDMGLTDVVAVPGVAVGSKALIAAKVHYPTKLGLSELDSLGSLPEGAKAQGYSPRQFSFLAHELAVRDMLVALSRYARENEGHSVARWDCSGNLQASAVHPDAVFWYGIDGKRIAGILEADMGTERGSSGDRFDRWHQKIQAYEALLGSEEELRGLTGSPRARLVVTVPDEARAAWIASRLEDTPVARSAWIGVREELAKRSVYDEVWQRPGGAYQAFCPLPEEGIY
ncbi:MAG: replication-relaxation family protein [Armatimonas sp.]